MAPWSSVTHTTSGLAHEPARATHAIVGPTAVMYCSTGTGVGGVNFPVAEADGVGRAVLVVAAAAGANTSAGAGRKAHPISTASATRSTSNPTTGATLRSSIGTASQTRAHPLVPPQHVGKVVPTTPRRP